MALSKTTQDHDEIQQWAEKRGAVPAEVTSTHSKNEPGILRFCFPKAPNHNNASLRELSWDEFFQKFDENGLELVYQEVTSEGAESNFNKLIYPTDENHSSRHGKSSTTHASSSHSSSSGSGAGKVKFDEFASHKDSGSHSKSSESHSKGSASHSKGSDSHSKSSASHSGSSSPGNGSKSSAGKSSGSKASGSKSSAASSSGSKSSGGKGTHKAA